MIFNSKKVIFARKVIFLRKLVLLKKTIYYIYISSKNLFFEQLNRSFNPTILCQLKISLFKLLSFSFAPFLFKIRGNILQFVVNWRRPRVIVNRLYTHASRNLSPPFCVLQSPATRNRSWLAEQRSRITSPSFISGSLLILRRENPKKNSPILDSLVNLEGDSFERKEENREE